MAGVTVHDLWVVPDLKACEVWGELQSRARLCASALAPSVLMISPALSVSKELIPYQILECPSHLRLGKDMSEGTPRASWVGLESWAPHSMRSFLSRISRTSLYFPYSRDKASPTLFCAFTSHVIAATSEMKKSPSN